jgi:hypothetical protein
MAEQCSQTLSFCSIPANMIGSSSQSPPESGHLGPFISSFQTHIEWIPYQKNTTNLNDSSDLICKASQN